MDDNEDGLQSTGEGGVSGVLIEAYDSNNSLVNSTTTDANGFYNMDYLGMDDYYLMVHPPANMGITYMDMGADGLDSDFGNIYGLNTTDMITLNPGDNIQNVDGGLINVTVVPVEWLYVTAENRGEFNHVEWATANEVNVSHFEVERSLKTADNFEKIGKNVASQSPANGDTYSIEDADLTGSGAYFYRIKEVDVDGGFTYSDIVSVRVNKKSDEVALYPNPARDEFNVSITIEEAQEIEIDLYDSKGSLVRKALYQSFIENGEHEFNVDIRDIPKGSYSIAIRLKNETIHKKLMIL